MKKLLFLILIFIYFTSIYSEETPIVGSPKKFNIPASEFISSGYNISISGTSEASHSNSAGPKHSWESLFFNTIFRNQLFNTSGGQFQRDNILSENREDYSYMNQPSEKKSPLGKIGISYTTKSSEWTYEISFRAKNYSSEYILGNNLPLEYYPGTMQYNWREGQYSIIRSHAISNFLMIQPQIGIREIREGYNRISDKTSYPIGKNSSSLHEESQTYSQQAGLTFHFKILEKLRFRLTGKMFNPLQSNIILNNNLQFVRNDIRYDGSNYYVRNMQSKTSDVKLRGNEIDGELSYKIKKFNFFLGYNLTTIMRDARNNNPNFFPSIVTNENLGLEYLRYFISNAIFDSNDNLKPRVQTLKYLYFGISLNF